MLLYDNNKEEQLNALIYKIDDNPVINTNPLEASSYLGVSLYTSEEGFHVYVQTIFDQFKEYLDNLIQNLSENPKSYTYIESALTRLLSKYQSAHTRFMESALRREWKTYSQYFTLSNPDSDYEIDQHVKYTRQAYKFFYKMSSIQLMFIDDIISYLSQQLQPFKNSIQDLPQSKNIAPIEESNPVYFFKLTKQASLNSRHILPKLHEGLKGLGYIDCTLPHFKRLFIKYTDKYPVSTPPAIIWNCEHYNHLGYFIKCLISGKFISWAKLPSNNEIALNLFHNGKEGNPYSTKGKRYDGRISPIVKAKIDTVIKNSGISRF